MLDFVNDTADVLAVFKTYCATAELTDILALHEYLVCYDTAHRVPLWVAYSFMVKELVQETRFDAFRTDPRLASTESAFTKNDS